MPKRVIVMNFEQNAEAYQGFSELKKLAMEGKVKGEQMAVVTHSNDGNHKFKVEDFLDFTGSNKTTTGGLIGMLIGIIGSPLLMLLGWFGGSLIGATQDAKEVRNATEIFEYLVNQIGEGQTGLVLIAEEDDNRPINEVIMNQLGGGISRFDYEEVEAEVQKAKDVEKTTKESAKKAWKDTHKDEGNTENTPEK